MGEASTHLNNMAFREEPFLAAMWTTLAIREVEKYSVTVGHIPP